MNTVLFLGNAAGEYHAPIVVYKGLNLCDSWTIGDPKGCKYVTSRSNNCFVPGVEGKEILVLVFLYGHGSHLTYKMVEIAI